MMWMTFRVFVAMGIASMAGLVSDGAMAATPSVDPCKLVTNAELEQIVGKLKAGPVGDQEGEARWCNYEFANGKDALELWVFPGNGLARAKKTVKNPISVTGLGTEAFIHRNVKLHYTELFLKKGDTTLEVALKESPGDEDKVKAIAKKAIDRL